MAVANVRAISPSQPSHCVHSSITKTSLNMNFALGPDWSWDSHCWFPIYVSNKCRRKSKSLHCHWSANRQSRSNNDNNCLDWDWTRWSRHFSEIELVENFASVLEFQLEEAIEKEDFQEAAKLKEAIKEATSKDSVAEIMSLLKKAIDEERYDDASRLSKYTGVGLVGWWVGCSKDADDPFGRLVHISPDVGRFIGRNYTPKQLVTASPGTPLFEIFVVKDIDGTYAMQVVYLQQGKGGSTNSTNSESEYRKGPPSPETGNLETLDPMKAEKGEAKGLSIEVATEEAIKNMLNFFKEKVPGLKVKFMSVDVTEEMGSDDSVKQLVPEGDAEIGPAESSEDEATNLGETESEEVAAGTDSEATIEEKSLDMKLFIGGTVHSSQVAPTKDDSVRLPAQIKDVERNSFVLHVPMGSHFHDRGQINVSKVKVAAIAAQGVPELMPSDVVETLLGAGKVSSEVSRDVREIVKHAIKVSQKRNRLSESTHFSRIITSESDLDPFDGLYVGAFGPYGMEVVQLRRKFGHWNGDQIGKSSDVEFFEYVEAVKLTGDLNVPAGQVTFRAKIAKRSRTLNRGMYPDELGVVTSYKGQGRIAEFGFRNPQWIEGELLQLNGKGFGPHVKGADLGFLYAIPEQSFLVLFSRLQLPN